MATRTMTGRTGTRRNTITRKNNTQKDEKQKRKMKKNKKKEENNQNIKNKAGQTRRTRTRTRTSAGTRTITRIIKAIMTSARIHIKLTTRTRARKVGTEVRPSSTRVGTRTEARKGEGGQQENSCCFPPTAFM